MATRKVWYTLSAVLMIVSLASFFMRGLNLAIDFTGGVNARRRSPQAAERRCRCARELTAAGFRDPQVQIFGSSRDIAIRLPPDPKQDSSAVRAQLETALQRPRSGRAGGAARRRRPAGRQRAEGERGVGAVLHAAAESFSTSPSAFTPGGCRSGAIFAVLHDPILVLGFFSLTQMSFDLAVVAAILAVIGYSLNDTVVVFDRIRERFEANRRSRRTWCSTSRSTRRCRAPS